LFQSKHVAFGQGLSINTAHPYIQSSNTSMHFAKHLTTADGASKAGCRCRSECHRHWNAQSILL